MDKDLEAKIKQMQTQAIRRGLPHKAQKIAEYLGRETEKSEDTSDGADVILDVYHRSYEFSTGKLSIKYLDLDTQDKPHVSVIYKNQEVLKAKKDCSLPHQVLAYLPGEWEQICADFYTKACQLKTESESRLEQQQLQELQKKAKKFGL